MLKLEKCRFDVEIGGKSFTNRVVDDRNRLRSQVVSTNSINSFKGRLDKCMDGDATWS